MWYSVIHEVGEMKRFKITLSAFEVEALDEDAALEDAVAEILMGNFDIEEVVNLDEYDTWY